MQDILIHKYKTIRPNGTEITMYREIIYDSEERISEDN